MSFSLMAQDISNFRYYQTDNIVPSKRPPFYAAYLQTNHPCIFVKDFKKNETKEYCQLGSSGLDLKRDYPSIYPTNIRLSAQKLYFIVAAPWNEQKCEIFLANRKITCEPTGK